MSRSALWRQEGNKKERETKAITAFQNAIEEGRSRHQSTKGVIPLYGSDSTFNMNSMLLHNISTAAYFSNKCCPQIHDYTTLVDEIYYEVQHLEPWGQDSPYIRGIGFLYLRYACEPTILWSWFEPYLYDEEPVRVGANAKMCSEITMGEFVRSLLTEMNYYGTLLPRLPVAIERDIKVRLLQAEQVEERALKFEADKEAMKYLETLGNPVRALYGDEENPVTWYDAVIDRVIWKEDDFDLKRPKFVVTFPEYGNTETVTLGEMDLPKARGDLDDEDNGKRRRKDDHFRRGRHGRGDDNERRGRRDEDFLSDEGRFRRGYDQDRKKPWSSHRGRGYDDDGGRHGNGRGGRGYDDDDHRGYGRYGDDDERGYRREGGARRDRYRDDSDRYGRSSEEFNPRERKPKGGNSRYDDGTMDSGRNKDTTDETNLMDEVLRRERERSTAKGKAYASRPATFKRSLAGSEGASMHHDVDHGRPSKRADEDHSKRAGDDYRDRSFSPTPGRGDDADECDAERRAVAEAKKRKLAARYS